MRKGPPRRRPPRQGPPGRQPPPQATSRITEEINQKARVVPVEKLQQGGAKFVRVITPSVLGEIVGKAILAVVEERDGGLKEGERAEIEGAARKQFLSLLGEHQKLLAEKQHGDQERAKLAEAAKKAEEERERARQERAQAERERARALAQADEQRAQLEQDRIKALEEARTQREAFEREREQLEAVQAEKSAADREREELQEQMRLLREEIESSRQVLEVEREREAEEGQLVLSPESVSEMEYRTQALLDRMMRDGELGTREGQSHGVEAFEQELAEAVKRVLRSARPETERSEAMDLLERRIAKLTRALSEREEALTSLEQGGDLHPRFRADPLAEIRAAERAAALVGAELLAISDEGEIEGDDEAGAEEAAGEGAEEAAAPAGWEATEPEPEDEPEPESAPQEPPWMREEPRPALTRAVAPDAEEFLSEEEPGFSRLLPLGSRPFLWRCGVLRMVFLENLELQGREILPDDRSGPLPTSSRLFDGGKVAAADEDPSTWHWPLHSN